jgi:hypothetical protein
MNKKEGKTATKMILRVSLHDTTTPSVQEKEHFGVNGLL